MLNRKTLVIAISSLAASVAIGGALLGSGSQAETDFSTQPADMRMAQSQVEPQPSQAEREFMDFTMPDLSKPQAGGETTRNGCVKPPRPEWVINRTPQEADNDTLLTGIYDLNRFRRIIETDSCPCEIEHPSWDDADREYQAVATGKDRAEIRALSSPLMRDVARLTKQKLDICREWQGR